MTSFPLSLVPIRATGDPSEVECPGCQNHLMIHQPEVKRPDRLLATCATCGAWSLIDAAAGLIVLLPDVTSRGDATTPVAPARFDRDLSPDDPAGTSSRSLRSRGGLRRA